MEVAADRSLSWHLDNVAADVAERPAVIGPSGALTYGELHTAALTLAGRLAPHVAATPTPIGLVLDHGADVLTGVLGCLRAGGIVAPLDPSAPPARLRGQLEYTAAAVVVTSARHAAAVRACVDHRIDTLVLEEVLQSGRHAPAPDLPLPPGGDAPAWLYQTSGSTGQPKGVLHSHRSLVTAAATMGRALALGASDRFTWFALASTSQGGSNLIGAMLAGGTLYPHAPRLQGLAAVPGWLRREGITVYNSSATFFRAIVSVLSDADTFPDMRIVRVGSERVRVSDFHAWRRHFPPPGVFVNRYSSTETGSIALSVLDHASDITGGSVPVGLPLAGKDVRIVDQLGHEVPWGTVGEIAVESANLALGYWRDTEGTDAAFVPVEGRPGVRRFRTGDLGRVRPGGQIEHLGRVDTRAKVRGHRVELEEIEGVLATHAGVGIAAAVVEPGPDGQDRLVATVVRRAGHHPTPRDLRAWLAARLPASSVPGAFFTADHLPLTPSGKLDRSALDAVRTPCDDEAPDRAAANDLERDLLAIWSEILGRQVGSVQHDFLSLGGDSLQGFRILARVGARWGVDLSFEELLDASSVAGLAELIGHRTAALRPAVDE